MDRGMEGQRDRGREGPKDGRTDGGMEGRTDRRAEGRRDEGTEEWRRRDVWEVSNSFVLGVILHNIYSILFIKIIIP